MTTKIARVYCDEDKVFTQDAVFKNLQESGAQLLPAAPYEHWMTGLPERGHRTITESAQACRLFAGMPKTAWGEAIMFALHAYNNTWTHGLAFPQTPNEAFHGKKFADARENIRIFGCLALPTISKEQPERSGKLSEHSTPCVYLRPDPHRDKVHRLLNHGRTKHVDVRYHWIREQVKQGVIQLKYKPSDEQLADLLSKPVSVTVFKKLMSLGFMGNSSSHP